MPDVGGVVHTHSGYASAWALEYLRDHTRLTERSYPGMGHSLSMPEIADVVRFLRPLLAG